MRRCSSPVQQWVDSLPLPDKQSSSLENVVNQQSVSIDTEHITVSQCKLGNIIDDDENFLSHSSMTVSTPIIVHQSPDIDHYRQSDAPRLARDPSFQSDSSHCSSVESLLELRRADPEAILLSLGFGGGATTPSDSGPLARIPKRFLQPSKLRGIALDDFVKHQQETNESLDSTSLGYRGLNGSPYVIPSEIVQKIMQSLREYENQELSHQSNLAMEQSHQEGKLSVLSPNNRLYLDRPRSKSPDMRNKRMIIGQQSFAFGRNGDLIEMNNSRLISNSAEVTDDNSDQASNTVGSRLAVDKRLDTAAAIDSSIDELCTNNCREDNQDNMRIRDAGSDSNFDDFEKSETKDRRKSLVRQDGLELNCAKCEKSDEEIELCCCTKSNRPECWREVIQNNQKLEDVVNKSRMEISELRDMLSNVLSMRTEPGF